MDLTHRPNVVRFIQELRLLNIFQRGSSNRLLKALLCGKNFSETFVTLL